MLRPFFDAHVHLNTTSGEKMKMAIGHDAYFLSINTDIPFFPSLEEQENTVHELNQVFNDRAIYICSFDMKRWGKEDWLPTVLKQIQQGIARGAKGVKMWKNIGMDAELRDENGNFLMLDHPVFDPIYEYIQANDLVLIGHQGEPKNCWLPLDEMTVDSDRNYFSAHPEYHMYLNPEYPSYEAQIVARDNVLRRHPKLKFVGLHLFSLEWNLDEVAKRLDDFPETMTDLAERICHVQYQAAKDHNRVKDFFVKYQDRIIYGTDVIDDGSLSAQEVADRLEHLWKFHWDFFATDNTMEAPEFKGKFKGLALPDTVLEKIFYSNAVNTYGVPGV